MDERKDKNCTKAQQTLLLNCCTLWHTFEKMLDLETLYRDHPETCDDEFVSSTIDVTESKREDFTETSGIQALIGFQNNIYYDKSILIF